MNIKQAKRLLKKGKEIGDTELIEMALEILEAGTPQPEETSETLLLKKVDEMVPKKRGRPKGASKVSVKATAKSKTAKKPTKVPEPILIRGKPNIFVDDGTECRGSKEKTPDYEPTPRSRPAFKEVSVKCTECDKVFKELPTPIVTGGFYRCVNCRKN